MKEINKKEFERYTLRLLHDGKEKYIIEQIWKSHGSSNRIMLTSDEFLEMNEFLKI